MGVTYFSVLLRYESFLFQYKGRHKHKWELKGRKQWEKEGTSEVQGPSEMVGEGEMNSTPLGGGVESSRHRCRTRSLSRTFPGDAAAGVGRGGGFWAVGGCC